MYDRKTLNPMKWYKGLGVAAFILSVLAVLILLFRASLSDVLSRPCTVTALGFKPSGTCSSSTVSRQQKGLSIKSSDLIVATESGPQMEEKAILASLGANPDYGALATKANLIEESGTRYRCLDVILSRWLVQSPPDAESWYDQLPRGKDFDPLAQRIANYFLKIDAESAVTWTLALSDLEAMGVSLNQISAYWGEDAHLVNALINAGLRDKPPVVIPENSHNDWPSGASE